MKENLKEEFPESEKLQAKTNIDAGSEEKMNPKEVMTSAQK